MTDCPFCAIAAGRGLCHRIWEDERHLAFLSIFPNTLGFSVVITRRHHPSYAFDLPDEVLADLVLAAKRVGRLLDRRLERVGRTGMILEGFGVDHAHAKLFPMHGTMTADWRPLARPADKYFREYEGYISSHDYRRADDKELAALARKIRDESVAADVQTRAIG
jgi:diadenosine tetraphosphate (Ap4A) HIT family hydrolase